MTVTEAPAGVIEQIGEHLRETRQEVHDLKTFIMGMEDRLTKRMDDGFATVDHRLDRIESLLGKFVEHFGLDWEPYGHS